jgi:hypothetical protein
MPANLPHPRLCVGIHGVISLYGFDLYVRPPGALRAVDGIQDYLSAAAREHLRGMSPRFELAWHSGWGERASDPAVGVIAQHVERLLERAHTLHERNPRPRA